MSWSHGGWFAGLERCSRLGCENQLHTPPHAHEPGNAVHDLRQADWQHNRWWPQISSPGILIHWQPRLNIWAWKLLDLQGWQALIVIHAWLTAEVSTKPSSVCKRINFRWADGWNQLKSIILSAVRQGWWPLEFWVARATDGRLVIQWSWVPHDWDTAQGLYTAILL